MNPTKAQFIAFLFCLIAMYLHLKGDDKRLQLKAYAAI